MLKESGKAKYIIPPFFLDIVRGNYEKILYE